MKKELLHTNQRGFFLVEVILASSVFILLVMVLVGAYLYGQEAVALAGARARATLLAEEELEAARNIRDDDFSNLSAGTHGLSISSGEWTLSGSSDTIGAFTRSVEITSVDSDRYDVESTVTWQQNPSRSGAVSLMSRLTDWQVVQEEEEQEEEEEEEE